MEEQSLDKIFDTLDSNMQNPELIKDNRFLFIEGDTTYCVKMPTQRDIAEANRMRKACTVKLLQKGKDEGYLLKEDLIAVLKKNGIDVVKIEEEIKQLLNDCIQIQLTVKDKKDTETEILKKLEENFIETEAKIRKLSNKKAEWLAPAIENQAEDVWYKYLTSTCTEKLVDKDKDIWKKLWKNYDEFQADSSSLPYLAEAHLSALVQNV